MGSFLHVLTLFLAISAAGFKVANGAASGQLPGLGAAKAGRGAYSSDSSSSGNVEYSKESYEYSVRNSEYVSYEDRSAEPYYFKTVEYKSGIREYFSDSDNQVAYAYSYSGYDGGSSTSIEEGSSYTVEYGSSSSVEYGSSSSSESGSSGSGSSGSGSSGSGSSGSGSSGSGSSGSGSSGSGSSGSGSSGSGSSGSGSAGPGSTGPGPSEEKSLDPLNFDGKDPINFIGGNKPNPDKIDPETGKEREDKFPGASLQLPGTPDVPGEDGPIGVIDPSGLDSNDIVKRDGPIVYLSPKAYPQLIGRYPGFSGTPGSRGPKGFLDINAIPGLSAQISQPFPGAIYPPIGFLNSSLLPPGESPPSKGPLIYPGDKGSMTSEWNFEGKFIPSSQIKNTFIPKIMGSFSFDQLIKLIKPLFPEGNLKKNAIPSDKLFGRDGSTLIPGIKGNSKNLQFRTLGSRVNKGGAKGQIFYFPELARLIAFLPPNASLDDIKTSGGFANPFSFRLSGTPGYVCALPQDQSIVDQKGALES